TQGISARPSDPYVISGVADSGNQQETAVAEANESGIPRTFFEAARQAAEAVGWQVEAEDPGGVTCRDASGVEQSIGLGKMYLRFKDRPQAEWSEAIADHLRKVITLSTRKVNDDLNSQADRIVVRLGQPYPEAPGLSIWNQPLEGTELVVMLVIVEDPG